AETASTASASTVSTAEPEATSAASVETPSVSVPEATGPTLSTESTQTVESSTVSGATPSSEAETASTASASTVSTAEPEATSAASVETPSVSVPEATGPTLSTESTQTVESSTVSGATPSSEAETASTASASTVSTAEPEATSAASVETPSVSVPEATGPTLSTESTQTVESSTVSGATPQQRGRDCEHCVCVYCFHCGTGSHKRRQCRDAERPTLSTESTQTVESSTVSGATPSSEAETASTASASTVSTAEPEATSAASVETPSVSVPEATGPTLSTESTQTVESSTVSGATPSSEAETASTASASTVSTAEPEATSAASVETPSVSVPEATGPTLSTESTQTVESSTVSGATPSSEAETASTASASTVSTAEPEATSAASVETPSVSVPEATGPTLSTESTQTVESSTVSGATPSSEAETASTASASTVSTAEPEATSAASVETPSVSVPEATGPTLSTESTQTVESSTVSGATPSSEAETASTASASTVSTAEPEATSAASVETPSVSVPEATGPTLSTESTQTVESSTVSGATPSSEAETASTASASTVSTAEPEATSAASVETPSVSVPEATGPTLSTESTQTVESSTVSGATPSSEAETASTASASTVSTAEPEATSAASVETPSVSVPEATGPTLSTESTQTVESSTVSGATPSSEAETASTASASTVSTAEPEATSAASVETPSSERKVPWKKTEVQERDCEHCVCVYCFHCGTGSDKHRSFEFIISNFNIGVFFSKTFVKSQCMCDHSSNESYQTREIICVSIFNELLPTRTCMDQLTEDFASDMLQSCSYRDNCDPLGESTLHWVPGNCSRALGLRIMTPSCRIGDRQVPLSFCRSQDEGPAWKSVQCDRSNRVRRSQAAPRLLGYEPCLQETGGFSGVQSMLSNTAKTARHAFGYLPNDGSCAPYEYSVAGNGSANRFDTQEMCEKNCLDRFKKDLNSRCTMTSAAQACLDFSAETTDVGSVQHYRYSAKIGACLPVALKESPECQSLVGKVSFFVDRVTCSETCVSQATDSIVQDRCFASFEVDSDARHCEFPRDMYFYSEQHRACIRRTVCPNDSLAGNSFGSLDECRQHCMPESLADVCSLPMDEGSCQESHVRFFYDANERTCREFVYSGCQGNRNRFLGLMDCERTCGSTAGSGAQQAAARSGGPLESSSRRHSSRGVGGPAPLLLPESNFSSVCQLPPSAGSCPMSDLVRLTRYFFDERTGQCRTFKFTGCGGNANNFETEEDCHYACLNFSELMELVKLSIPAVLPTAPACTDNDNPNVQMVTAGSSAIQLQTAKRCPSRLSALLDILSSYSLTVGTATSAGPCALADRPRWTCCRTAASCRQRCPPKSRRMHPQPTSAIFSTQATSPAAIRCVRGVGRKGMNFFVTWSDCKRHCYPELRQRVCYLAPDPGPCGESLLRFSYDPDTGSCQEMRYSGCLGNRNRFLSLAECHSVCETPLLNDPCLHPVSEGRLCGGPNPLLAQSWRYYYNYDTKQCSRFLYNGCGGNPNRFGSYRECQARCAPEADTQAIQTAGAVASAQRAKRSIIQHQAALPPKTWNPEICHSDIGEEAPAPGRSTRSVCPTELQRDVYSFSAASRMCKRVQECSPRLDECPADCPYGRHRRFTLPESGCRVCRCHDPCSAAGRCGSLERCRVHCSGLQCAEMKVTCETSRTASPRVDSKDEGSSGFVTAIEGQPVRLACRRAVRLGTEPQSEPLVAAVVWKKDGISIGLSDRVSLDDDKQPSDPPGSALWFAHAELSDSGVYRCHGNGDLVFNTVRLSVLSPARITGVTTSGLPLTNRNQTALLVCDVRGQPPPTVRWFRYDQLQLGPLAEGARLRLTAQPGAEGVYLCQAGNSIGLAGLSNGPSS
uniref:BPTI/Kunitz inhibitor domain-containing protein n=1 Tax=Macrostomum lignano TaxID=282301 RepID=A0A1I8F1R4_9PLAT